MRRSRTITGPSARASPPPRRPGAAGATTTSATAAPTGRARASDAKLRSRGSRTGSAWRVLDRLEPGDRRRCGAERASLAMSARAAPMFKVGEVVRTLLRQLSTILILAGLLLLADVGLTLVWQEPVSTLYARLAPGRARRRPRGAERARPAPGRGEGARAAAARQRAGRVPGARTEAADRRRATRSGASASRRSASTRSSSRAPTAARCARARATTRRRRSPASTGPSRSPATAPPTARRSTSSTSSSSGDEIVRRDALRPLRLRGGATSRSSSRRATWVTRRVGHDRLVLTACHPKYSAAQRIVIFARLKRTEQLAWTSVRT